jgi:hypothetical protein
VAFLAGYRPGGGAQEHIFVGSKANWFQISDTLSQRIEPT